MMNTKTTLTAALLCLPCTALASGHAMIGGGGGGDADAGNLSLEAGLTTQGRNHNWLVGLGLVTAFTADDMPSDRLDYPISGPYFSDLGRRNDGPEYGMYGQLGIETVPKSGVYAFGLAGVTTQKRVHLVRSNLTGFYYEQRTGTQYNAVYGAGIGYFPASHRIGLEIEYDNRRGITGLIGFQF